MADPSAPNCPITLSHLQSYHTRNCLASPIYAIHLSTIHFTHASRGYFLARLPITPTHLNNSHSLHGSVSATIVDWAGGLAIAAWDLRWATGPSVDINVSYLEGCQEGTVVEIEGRVERVGGNLGFTSVGIWKVGADGKRGAAVVLGRHTKFLRFSEPGKGVKGALKEEEEKSKQAKGVKTEEAKI